VAELVNGLLDGLIECFANSQAGADSAEMNISAQRQSMLEKMTTRYVIARDLCETPGIAVSCADGASPHPRFEK